MKRLILLIAALFLTNFATTQAATYDELKAALGDQALKDKVQVSILIVVDKIIQGEDTDAGFDQANHDNRAIWARRIMSNPQGSRVVAAQFLPILIVSSRAAAVEAILNASDATIQSQVEEIVDLFADGT